MQKLLEMSRMQKDKIRATCIAFFQFLLYITVILHNNDKHILNIIHDTNIH